MRPCTTPKAWDLPLQRVVPKMGLVGAGGGVGHQQRSFHLPNIAVVRAGPPNRVLITRSEPDHDLCPLQCQCSDHFAPVSRCPTTKPFLHSPFRKLVHRLSQTLSILLSVHFFHLESPFNAISVILRCSFNSSRTSWRE